MLKRTLSPTRLRGAAGRVLLSGLVAGGVACSGQEEGSPTPTEAPTPTPEPTPFSTVMCEWDEAPEVTALEPWWYDAVFYEIFVRSFQDSNGDGIGDLPGLISRLDYLNDGDPNTHTDLGVTALWLMPIFSAQSVHGYDVIDYFSVEPDYGTEADLVTLLEQAHARGMRVILDLPFNHTSLHHPWFQDSSLGPESAYRDYYVWSETQRSSDWTGRNGAYYYAAFDASIPDLNYASPAVLEALASIYAHWLNLGLDGFRLDGAKYLVEDGAVTENTPRTHCYLQAMRRYLAKGWPDAVLVGEVWSDAETIASYFGSGLNELPTAFDFKLSDGIVNAINFNDATRLTAALAGREFYGPDPRMFAPFLRNHDMDRTGSVFDSEAQRFQAAVIALALSGPTFLYYGEEIGMSGARGSANNDNARRSPMQWTGEAGAGFTDPGVTPWYPINAEAATVNVAEQQARGSSGDSSVAPSLWQQYQRLIQLRLEDSGAVLRGEAFQSLSTTHSESAAAFLRGSGDGAILVALNVAEVPLSDVQINLEGVGSWTSGQELLTGRVVDGPIEGQWQVGELPPYGIQLIHLSDVGIDQTSRHTRPRVEVAERTDKTVGAHQP